MLVRSGPHNDVHALSKCGAAEHQPLVVTPVTEGGGADAKERDAGHTVSRTRTVAILGALASVFVLGATNR